jgi:hypothetical protein
MNHREHNLLHLHKAETCDEQFTIQLQKLQKLEIDILINYYEKMAVRIREQNVRRNMNYCFPL